MAKSEEGTNAIIGMGGRAAAATVPPSEAELAAAAPESAVGVRTGATLAAAVATEAAATAASSAMVAAKMAQVAEEVADNARREAAAKAALAITAAAAAQEKVAEAQAAAKVAEVKVQHLVQGTVGALEPATGPSNAQAQAGDVADYGVKENNAQTATPSNVNGIAD